MARTTPSYTGYSPTSAKASKIASKIKSSDTKAEKLLRSFLWRRGLRFFKNVKTILGKPDIVFPKERVVVFCDGDFWHGKNWEGRKERLRKGANAPYWVSKIEANMSRDQRHNQELSNTGWHVIRLWESDILSDPESITSKVADVVLSRRNKIATPK